MYFLDYSLEHTRLYVGSSIELFRGALCVELVGKSAVCRTLGFAGGLNKSFSRNVELSYGFSSFLCA